MDMFSEKISPGKNLLVGFQHVLAMCPGTIAAPLIMGGAMGLDARTTAYMVSANHRLQIPYHSGLLLCTSGSHDHDWQYLRPSHPVWSHYGIRCPDFSSFLFPG